MTAFNFLLDLVERLMVCEIPEPRVFVRALEDLSSHFRLLPFTNTLRIPGITYTFRHMCCQSRGNMVAENILRAELLSGCGVISAWSEDRHPCFVWVLNMLDFILLGSMDIGS